MEYLQRCIWPFLKLFRYIFQSKDKKVRYIYWNISKTKIESQLPNFPSYSSLVAMKAVIQLAISIFPICPQNPFGASMF